VASTRTKLRNSLLSEAETATSGRHGVRHVDLGIEIRVVRADSGGREYLRGKPPLRVIRREQVGGRWDCTLRRFDGPARRWRVWYLSERQAAIVLGDDPVHTRVLLYSAEGGGKTVTGAMWAIVQVLRLAAAGVFVAGGATAPTHARLQTLVKAVCERIPTDTAKDRRPGAWATYYSDEGELRFVTGHVVQFRATKRASAATGSPVQGFTWGWSLDDELQDTVENGADPDIEARLRGAKVSRRLGTATAKDSPLWRSFRDSKLATPDWSIERIRFDENPFVWADHWDRMRRNVSAREWQRRGLAMDVGPERMTYTAWDRAQNLRPVPQLGAEDVTRTVLSPWGPRFAVLVGHDPGKLCDVSLVLQAFQMRGQSRPSWWVRDELTTDQTTTEQHVKALLQRLRDRWQCNQLDWRGNASSDGPVALVRADPYSNSGNDSSRPDRSVYTLFRKGGIPSILPAAMKASTSENKAATVPVDAGIGMVNGLLCNADGERRLFVECDENRQPLAPRLVEAIEMSERDGDGYAERQKKDRHDLSHWCAALRYALWAIERPRMEIAA
jgi:hypothetical protein